LMSIVSLVIAPYIAQPSSNQMTQLHQHHATEMMQGMECSPEKMKALEKNGEKCSPEKMAAAKKAKMGCCEKPGMANRFKSVKKETN